MVIRQPTHTLWEAPPLMLPKAACFQAVAGIPTSVTVSVFGRLRLTLILRKPCFDGLETAEIPRRATTMLVGAIEPDEHLTRAG